MPVTLIVPTLASNKAKIPLSVLTKLGKDKAYVRVIKGANVYVCKPRIDKISVTIAINCTEAQGTILELLEGAVKHKPGSLDPSLDDDHGVSYASKLKVGQYKFYYKFCPPGTEQVVHLAVQPKKKGTRFMRLEFNPDQLGPTGVAALRDFIDKFFAEAVTYQHVLENSVVTRIDIACDLVNVPMGTVLVSSKLKGKSMHFVGDDGLETTYQGKKSKAAPVKVYDKHKQIVDAKKGTPPYGELSHVRIEVTKVTNTIPLHNLGKLANAMKSIDLHVAAPEKLPEKEHHWRLFVDSCQFRGVDGALGQIPMPLRNAYSAALNGGSAPLWDANTLWKFWPQVVAESGLLGPVDSDL